MAFLSPPAAPGASKNTGHLPQHTCVGGWGRRQACEAWEVMAKACLPSGPGHKASLGWDPPHSLPPDVHRPGGMLILDSS